MANLSFERLNILWQRVVTDTSRNNEDIVERFAKIQKTIEKLETLQIDYEGGKAKIGTGETNLSFAKFGPGVDELLTDSGEECFNNIKEALPSAELKDLNRLYWELIAGWDKAGSIREDFRIISKLQEVDPTIARNEMQILTCLEVLIIQRNNLMDFVYMIRKSRPTRRQRRVNT